MRINGIDYRDNDLRALAADLSQLTEAGFKVMPLASVIDAWLGNRGGELNGKIVALACDHGTDFDYLDLPHPTWGTQRSVFNILRDFERRNPGRQDKLHVTSFVVASPEARAALDSTCLIGRGWWSDGWWQPAIRSGLMHIGNNSWDYHHDTLPESFYRGIARGKFSNIDSPELADYEIKQAARYLAAHAPNAGLALFAYPYGESNRYLTHEYFPARGRELGIKAALTAQPGFLEPGAFRWEIPRFLFRRDWSSPGDLQVILDAAIDDERIWVRVSRTLSTAAAASTKEATHLATFPKRAIKSDKNPWADSTNDEGFQARFTMVPKVLSEWIAPYGGLAGRDIMDFGCGEGISALGLALNYAPRRIVGVDIGPDPDRCLPIAEARLGLDKLPENLALHRVKPGFLHSDEDSFDLVYSWSVFEHVDQRLIRSTLKMIRSSLKPQGLFLVQIAPLYYSAEGSHLIHKIPEPWAHLLIQHDTLHERLVAAVPDRKEFLTLWGTYRTLNRMTVGELLEHLTATGFEILRTWTAKDDCDPPARLKSIFQEETLLTSQIVALARPA